VVSPRFIEEQVPNDYVGTCITIFTFAQNLGLLVAMFIAVILPDDLDTAALEANESWRIIFGLPLVSYTLILIGLTFLVPYDSAKFHMSNNQRYKALKSIHRTYDTGGSERQAQRIYNYIKRNSTQATSTVTFSEAFVTDEMYRRASWTNVAIIVFSELTGFQAIMLYSNIIFTEILGENSKFNPR